jgi:hypothetical protein
MLILGLVLLVIGFIADVAILKTLGIIVLVIGAVLWILGSMGAPGWRPSALLVARRRATGCSDDGAVNDIVSVSGHLPSAREDLRRSLQAWVPELVKRRARWAGWRRPLVNVAICIRHGR